MKESVVVGGDGGGAVVVVVDIQSLMIVCLRIFAICLIFTR